MKIRKAIIPAAGLERDFCQQRKHSQKKCCRLLINQPFNILLKKQSLLELRKLSSLSAEEKDRLRITLINRMSLEDTLLRKNKLEMLAEVQNISNLANIVYVRQKEPLGLGHAILCAKSVIGDEPFAVLLGDDIVMSETPCLKQIIDVFEYYNSSVVAVQTVADHDVSKYGIIKPKGTMIESDLFHIDSLVEKPSVDEAPSRYAIMGRYVLSPEIFEILERIPLGRGDELQLTDAINELNKQQAVFAYNFTGKRYDIGDKIGFIMATIDFALSREDIRESVEAYLQDLNDKKNVYNSKRETD